MTRRDHANTQWLKGVVAEHGWPLMSQVGQDASTAAWLLVQHADADPLFQLEALHLMEPLFERGEVAPQNYAYLHDRIMLKLTGRQRYGTQAWCGAQGELEAQPLEEETHVDALRAEVGLQPLAEYIGVMRERSGPCTPPPPSAR